MEFSVQGLKSIQIGEQRLICGWRKSSKQYSDEEGKLLWIFWGSIVVPSTNDLFTSRTKENGVLKLCGHALGKGKCSWRGSC